MVCACALYRLAFSLCSRASFPTQHIVLRDHDIIARVQTSGRDGTPLSIRIVLFQVLMVIRGSLLPTASSASSCISVTLLIPVIVVVVVVTVTELNHFQRELNCLYERMVRKSGNL